MEQRKYKTKQEVLIRGQEAVGKTLGEIDKPGRIATGKGAIGTVLLLCIDPKAKFELVCRNGLRVVIVPPNHPLFRETLETMSRLHGFVHLIYAALHDLASGVAPTKVFAYAVNQRPNDYREWSKGIGNEADEVLSYIIAALSTDPKFYRQFAVFAD